MTVKRERFVRLTEARVSKALQAIRVIGNLANKNHYEYTEADLRKIVKALGTEIDGMASRFRNAESKARPAFKL